MTNIDTAVASLLASGVDSLLSIGSRSNAATAQTGTSALTVDTPSTTGVPTSLLSNQPQASAQTVLSAIALTLDAIMRSGGDATPSLVGQWPIWPVVPALDGSSGAQTGAAPGGNTPAGNPPPGTTPGGTTPSSTPASPATAQGTQSSAAVTPSAVTVPVDALAAALRQTVTESGLFYEAHLAQWLSGQRPPESLADEPQNRLVARGTQQMPLGWTLEGDADADSESLSSWWHGGSPAQPASGAAQNEAAHQGQANASPMSARFAAAVQEFAEDAFGTPSGQSAQAARDGQTGNPGNQANAAQAQLSSQAMAASVHPATVTLVRQQLDLLATGEFRWSGEAWPGARLDWTIEEGTDRWSRGGNPDRPDGDDLQPWRTRLTLSLPVLGTVDAELTLIGMQLVARVQASPSGAARLAAQGESFRQRLAAVGIALNALSVREIVGGAPGGGSGTQAAYAYARSAATAAAADSATDAHASEAAASSSDLFDGDVLL
jgi:hypothetical protein